MFTLKTRLTRLGLSLIILIQFTLAPIAQAGPMTDAKSYTEKTHQAANSMAESMLRGLLAQALSSLTNNSAQIGAGMHHDLSASLVNLSEAEKEIQKTEQYITQLKKKAAQGKQMSPEDLERIIEKWSKYAMIYESHYRTVVLNKERLHEYAFSAGELENIVFIRAKEFEKAFVDICSQGVAVDINSPNLPALKPLLKPFSVQVDVMLNEDGGMNGNVAAAYGENSPINEAAMALGYAGSVILGEYLVTGKIVLSGASSISWGGFLAGTGIFLGVLAVIVIINDIEAKKQAREIRKAQEHVFFNKANSESVRKAFKNICAELSPKLAGFSEQLKTSVKNGLNPWEAEAAKSQSLFDQMHEKAKAYHAKQQQIIESHLAGSSEGANINNNPFAKEQLFEKDLYELKRKRNQAKQLPEQQADVLRYEQLIAELKEKQKKNEEVLNSLFEEMAKTPEAEELKEQTAEIGLKEWVDLIKHSFFINAQNADFSAKEITKAIQAGIGGLNTETMRENVIAYSSVSQNLRKLLLEKKNINRWKKNDLFVLKNSLGELDHLTVQYIESLFTNFDQLKKTEKELFLWYKKMQKQAEENPGSELLTELVEHYQFLQSLNHESV